jgi:hypothetical protein
MKTPRPSTNSSFSPSFALISVLALVSLAALTATAFLASARLERQATLPLTQTTMLDMALDSGSVAALRLLEYGAGEQFNHVVTYWRGSGANAWTNELGYLLIGSVQSNDIATNSRKVKYYFCFSSAALTNLATNLIEYTNHESAGNQAQFTRQIKKTLEATSTRTGTNFAAGQSTNIPLLGDIPIPTNGPNRFTSPPVGWVYINQDVRVKPGFTNTTNVPVARFAFYVQDLSSMVDAERMGGFTNGTPFRQSTNLPANYTQGTNPTEISLTNLTGTVLTNSTNAANFTSTNNRAKYLSPGMLVLSNAGKLNTNDLRYVTTGLRHWTNAYERIPFGLGYSNCGTSDKGTNKYCLEPVSSLTVANIRNHITSNCPPFATNGTNGRAGGMDGSAYVTALAANIIDYADADSTATSTTTTGVNIVGFDSYPMLTHVFDRIAYTTNPAQVSVVTYIQLWNPSTMASSTNLAFTFLYDFADTLCATGTVTSGPQQVANNPRLTNRNSIYSNSLGNSYSFSFTTNLPSISTNGGMILSFTNSIPVPGTPAPEKIWINGTNNGSTNIGGFTLRLAGSEVLISKMLLKREDYDLTNNQFVWKGTLPVLRYSPNPLGDPRISNFLVDTNGSDTFASFDYATVYWSGYPAGSAPLSAMNPANWPDGTNTSNNSLPTSGTNYTAAQTPSLGIFSIPNPAPCKISNFGSYTNICELGNIFDPIQWAPPSTTTSYANCNIPAGTTWTNNNLYGGGSTLRIGRPEHSRFAWTNPSSTASDPSIPNMQMSAAALLDLFCLSNQFDEGGKINLNTAPAPVLRALAGGIYLRSDPALLAAGTNAGGANFCVPPAMAEAFAQGVMRFRAKYPFYSPSQLAFIGTEPSWPDPSTWPSGAVFGSKDSMLLNLSAPGNSSGASATMGVTAWNDQATEEWFAKIFKLSTVYSRNFRVYVIAQKATNSSGAFIGVGPVVRKYYNVLIRQNGEGAADAPGASPVTTFQSYY